MDHGESTGAAAMGGRRTPLQVVDEEIFERLRLHGLTFLRDAAVIAAMYVLAEDVRFDGAIPPDAFRLLIFAMPAIIFAHLFFIWVFGIHRRLWQYAGIRDVRAILLACVLGALTIAVLDLAVPDWRPLPLLTVPTGSALAVLGLAAVRVWRDLIHIRIRTDAGWERVLIVGAGQAGQLVVADLLSNPEWHKYPVAILDDDPRAEKMRVRGVPVIGTVDMLSQIVEAENVDIIAIAIPSASPAQLDRILALAQETSARIQVLPSHAEVMTGKAPMRLRDLNLDDLLDRDPSDVLDDPMVQRSIGDRVILVTGARGSIGFEICRQVLRLNPVCVLALDNNETGLFYLQRELRTEANGALIKPVLADITDHAKLAQIFERYRPDVIFHAAAYKHVPMLEAFPEEAIAVNVNGTLNLCRLADEHGCERFVFVSTDKAVQPVNVLGFSKRIGELVVRAHADTDTAFCCVRFGNVVGSRGSALPEFVRQIDAGGTVTITHPDVERYFMTISEAVSLVIRAGAEAVGGELFMLDMGQPLKIADIVKRIIRLRGLRVGKDIEIVYTGLRPGEKLTEELVFPAEQVHATTSDAIFRVEDPVSPDLDDLEASIAILSQATKHQDEEMLRVLLAGIAAGEPAPGKIELLPTGLSRGAG